jgi:hypothetical protein
VKNSLFAIIGWTLLVMAWCFAVLNVSRPIYSIASHQKKLYEFKADEEYLHTIGFETIPGEPVSESPTWPIWLIYCVGIPADFAASFPYWTIFGGILCFIWCRLLAQRWKTNWLTFAGNQMLSGNGAPNY